jgi:molecular chaperone DnaK
MTNTIDYGIDLGTTNSCVARWEDGMARVFQNNDQMNVTPSAVHVLKTGRVIVGRRAYNALLSDPENVAVEFKRWMGQKDRKFFPAAKREFSSEQLAAEVLKSLREDVHRQTGADVKSAVITVPAAFGALQCEATARAADLAGLEEAPLLQEPIAAAIAYGARTGSANQRWLVFDLGGGTLDVAVVSTRDGRLNVVEHRGNNLLGGKDIDRALVDYALMPTLETTYDLRSSKPGSARHSLIPKLRSKAEEAKIDLSTRSDVVVSLLDLGDDDSGTPVDLEITITQAQLEALSMPLYEKCFSLVDEALAGARMSGGDLDRILLVGGPTQSPLLRKMLGPRVGALVDFSIDPMTVVGRGAAIYASTLERTKTPAPAPLGRHVSLKLAYDPVSPTVSCTVAGRIVSGWPDVEIKIDADGGFWTSGWVKPIDTGFEIPLTIKEGDLTTFWVYARNDKGDLLETDRPEFAIRHGLVTSAPPLPHTLSVEVVNGSSDPTLDPIFAKGTLLPAARTVKYRATAALIPNNPNSDLAIKLWEGEFLENADVNEWVGSVLLSHDSVKRTLPEGSEIEVRIEIDASRKMTVSAFAPLLNQHFSGELYAPQRDEQDFADLADAIVREGDMYRDRLRELEERITQQPGASAEGEIEDLRKDIDELERSTKFRDGNSADPDSSRRIVEDSKTVRGRLGRLERKFPGGSDAAHTAQLMGNVEGAREVVNKFGSALEKQQFALLQREMERAGAAANDVQFKRAAEEINALRWRVLTNQDWFWKEMLDSLRQPNVPFVSHEESRRLIAQGLAAASTGDGKTLREVVRKLWDLQPKDAAELGRDRAMRSGLRKY